MPDSARSLRFWIPMILGLAVIMYALRLTAPSDLEGYAQYRNIGYVLDVVHHGEWLTQHDLQGRILSKPPLHTWLIASCVHVFGNNRFALTLPSFFAVTVLGLLVFSIGRRQFGLFAGAFAAIAVVASPLFSKQIAMVRSDPLFALLITAGMWAAWRAWREGKGWTLFWFIGALGTLTKGPLAVLLAGIGLTAWFWERRTDPTAPRPAGSHWTGLLVFFAVCFAWIVPALLKSGRELVDMMLYGELLGQATGVSNGKIPLSNFPLPTLNVLSRFAPFSLLAFYGIWRVFRHPATSPDERRFERFLACTALGGLLVFSLAAHFRSDLILPLWAPLALLAGREASVLAARFGRTRFNWVWAATIVALFVVAYTTYHPAKGPRSRVTDESEQVRAAAEALMESGISPDQLVHIGTPTTLQMYLHTAHRWVKPADVRALFTEGRPKRLLVTGDEAEADAVAQTGAASAREVFRWPVDLAAAPVVQVYELGW
jgi:4-amino-4-deoxy-L-arabinose transferase-like glycosyltransferase